jgi:hypothetical protein
MAIIEHIDLAKEYPDVVADLKARLAKFVKTAYQTGTDGEGDCKSVVDTMKNRYKGFWGPFCGDLPSPS